MCPHRCASGLSDVMKFPKKFIFVSTLVFINIYCVYLRGDMKQSEISGAEVMLYNGVNLLICSENNNNGHALSKRCNRTVKYGINNECDEQTLLY